MTLFIQPGDEPLDAAQFAARTQAHIERDWPEWRRQRSIRLGDGLFNDYMLGVSADTDANRAVNGFNAALAIYRPALARLGCAPVVEGSEVGIALDAADRAAAQAVVDATPQDVKDFAEGEAAEDVEAEDDGGHDE